MYSIACLILNAPRKKEKNASKKQVAVCNHNIIMKKRSYSKIAFIYYQTYIIPTNHYEDWHYDDYYVMQKLFIPQRLMASGYFY